MKIGELVRATEVPADTLRYYESMGLLDNVQRHSNGYRDYPAGSVLRIQFIKKAKQVGFKLDEIRRLLAIKVTSEAHTCEEVKQFTADKLSEIERKINDLNSIHSTLLQIHKSCCGGPESAENCSILTALEQSDA